MHDRLFGGELLAFRDCVQHTFPRSPVELRAYLYRIDRSLLNSLCFGTTSDYCDIDFSAIPADADAVLRREPTIRVLY